MQLDEGSKVECFRWLPVLLEIVQHHNPDLADKYSNV